jgi:hypothetical protein
VRAGLVPFVVVGALGLAACSTGPTGHAAGSATTTTPAPTTTQPAPTTTQPTTSNLVVTDQIRSELVAAGATLNSLPASAYTGLRPGETYYAYDATTQTYWAGAGLLPSSSSTPAQVSTQDDGAYLLFTRTATGAWKAYDVGLAGTPDGTPCSITVPSAILALWNWPAGSCRPSTIS